MIKRSFTLAIVALFALSAPAFAGAKKKKGAGGGRVLAHFDRNHDGSIDAKEGQRMIATYSALAALDTDHNGTLSESEVAAAKIPMGGKKGAKKKATN